MASVGHLNELEYVDTNEQTVRIQLHDGRMYFQIKDPDTGNVNTPRVMQEKDILIIKDMYGGNGYERNLSVKFGVLFPNAKPTDLVFNTKQALQKLLTNEEPNEGSILSEMVLDTSAGGHTGINIIFTVSYDPNGEATYKTGAAKALLDKVKAPATLSTLFSSLAAPFNGVSLLSRFDIPPKILHKNVPASIVKVTLSSVDGNTVVDVVTVGCYDHISMKYDTATVIQEINDLVRVRENVLTYTYTGLDINTITKFYVYLNDKDYQELYSFENTVSSGVMAKETAVRRSLKNGYY
jgi:hypothetical protein